MSRIDRAAAEAALLNAHVGVVCLSSLMCQMRVLLEAAAEVYQTDEWSYVLRSIDLEGLAKNAGARLPFAAHSAPSRRRRGGGMERKRRCTQRAHPTQGACTCVGVRRIPELVGDSVLN